METNGNVNLSISKEIVNPIVEAKIKAAVVEAMGGSENLIAMVIDKLLNQKVNHEGNISNYSSDNTHRWLDIAVTKQVKDAVKESMTEILKERKQDIKDAIKKQLASKKGIELFAESLLSGLKLDDKYRTSINVKFEAKGY